MVAPLTPALEGSVGSKHALFLPSTIEMVEERVRGRMRRHYERHCAEIALKNRRRY